MHKALTKLELAAAEVESETLDTAVNAFAAVTQSALDDLAFDFAKDLRDEFAARGETVNGRPPILTVGILTLKIDIAARKGQWFYGKEALIRPIPLSLTGVLKAYDQQVKDYERPLFVRDMVLLREQGAVPFSLGVATKSQTEQSNRSIWLPETAVDGQYYSDITFE